MSWSYDKIGTARHLATVLPDEMANAGGAFEGPEKEAQKQLADTTAMVVKALEPELVVEINASGSAWRVEKDGATEYKSFSTKLEIKTRGAFAG